jgi:hypothetical protein
VEFIPGKQAGFNISKSIYTMHCTDSRKDKIHIIISIDVGHVADKIQYCFMIKMLNK